MRIIGIDPGMAITGYGIIDIDNNRILNVVTYGCIVTHKRLTLPQRLLSIHQELMDIISKYQPDVAAVEELFFCKNLKTALNVGYARGVILLVIAETKLEVVEYTPLQVKQAVCGAGHASKIQIQKAIKLLLNITPTIDDVTDALAIAICHAWNIRKLLNDEVR
jgi:crossover junction endodeoxyribonuclease RuvC